jgi:hypothetical protein
MIRSRDCRGNRFGVSMESSDAEVPERQGAHTGGQQNHIGENGAKSF